MTPSDSLTPEREWMLLHVEPDMTGANARVEGPRVDGTREKVRVVAAAAEGAVGRLMEQAKERAGNAEPATVTFTFDPGRDQPWTVAAPFITPEACGGTMEESAAKLLGDASGEADLDARSNHCVRDAG